jgi:hypothetical protein
MRHLPGGGLADLVLVDASTTCWSVMRLMRLWRPASCHLPDRLLRPPHKDQAAAPRNAAGSRRIGWSGDGAIQLGIAAGAQFIATAGGPEKVARCRELAAALFVERGNDDFLEAIREATAGRGRRSTSIPSAGMCSTGRASTSRSRGPHRGLEG